MESSSRYPGDYLTLFEYLTEARLQKLVLEDAAVYATVSSLAQGGHWKKALDILEGVMMTNDLTPDEETLMTLLGCCARAAPLAGPVNDDEDEALVRSLALMEKVGVDNWTAPLLNEVIGLTARTGDLEKAEQMIDNAMLNGNRIKFGTFNTVAAACMKFGDGDRASEILEMRDFL